MNSYYIYKKIHLPQRWYQDPTKPVIQPTISMELTRKSILLDCLKNIMLTNVHGAGSTDSLPAWSSEGQSWINFILDLQCIAIL